jgi:hypothetical protein
MVETKEASNTATDFFYMSTDDIRAKGIPENHFVFA